MKNKKLAYTLGAAAATVAVAAAAVAAGTGFRTLKADDNSIWNHYDGSAHLDIRGNKEYWVNCTSHEHVFAAPDVSADRIVDKGAVAQSEIDSWDSSDDRVINKRRRVLTFESDASQANYIVSGARTNGLSAKEVVTGEGCGEGASSDMKALKLTVTGTDTINFALNDDYMYEAFADPNVKGLRFDIKSNYTNVNFSYRTWNGSAGSNKRYEDRGDAGFGVMDRYKSLFLPRSYYESWAAADANGKKQHYLCYSNIGTSDGSNYIMIDNIRPVTDDIDPVYKLDAGRLIPQTGDYANKVSIRRWSDGGEAVVIRSEDTTAIAYGFDYTIKSEGVSSIKMHKVANKAMHFLCPKLPVDMADDDELVFDIYSTVNFNVGVAAHKGPYNGPGFTGDNPGANTWATFAVKKSEFAANNQFLTLTGSLDADIYLDNIRFRKAGTNLFGFESDEISLTDVTTNNRLMGRYGGTIVTDPIIRQFQTNRATTHIGVTTGLASEGTKSLHIGRPGANEVALWLGKAHYTRIQNGEILLFDLYSTSNGTTAKSIGDGNRNAYSETILPVRQWNTIAVDSSHITSDGRFFIINSDSNGGNAKGDFYLDNFRFA